MKHDSTTSQIGARGGGGAPPERPSGHSAELDSLQYLEELQQPLEAIGLGQEQNIGRFCGYCYGRLADTKGRSHEGPMPPECRLCGRTSSEAATIASVPPEVLAIYLAKRGREGLIVNLFAFFGIFLSLVFSCVLWFLLPDNWWKLLSLALLPFTSYNLARFFGLWLGATFGYNSGAALRSRRWMAFVTQRDGPIAAER